MIRVYHRDNTRFNDDVEYFKIGDYTHVATVDTKNLETAYRLTNSIDDYWWNNDLVSAIIIKTRSTSMGDVLESEGKFYVVAICGFRHLPVRTMDCAS